MLAIRLSRRHAVAYVLDADRTATAWIGAGDLDAPAGVRVVRPLDLPLQRVPAFRRTATSTTAGRIRSALGNAPGPLVCVVYPNADLDVVASLKPDLVVYVATDDFSRRTDGSDAPDPRFADWEERAVAASGLVVPIAEVLQVGRSAAARTRVRVLNQAYDDELYDGVGRPTPPALSRLPRPLLGFAGTVRASRIDVRLLVEVATARPDLGFAFVGPVIEERGSSLSPVRALPNTGFFECSSATEVPAFIHAFDVAMAPYRDLHVNRGYYPLKVLDALAMGRPAIVSPHSELAELHPHAVFVRESSSFVAAVESHLRAGNGPDASAARRAAVVSRSLSSWIERFESEVAACLANPRRTRL